MDMHLSKLWVLVMDREAWRAAIHEVQRVRYDGATELNSTEIGEHYCWNNFPGTFFINGTEVAKFVGGPSDLGTKNTTDTL